MKHEILKAKIVHGDIRCPCCGSKLGEIYYGGFAMGVGLWCRSCHKPVLVEAPERKQNMRRHRAP